MILNNLLFINGAAANKNRTEYLRQELAKFYIEGYSFNFRNSNNSLKKRYIKTIKVIKSLNLKEPLNLCGSSMGAYTAIQLLNDYIVNNLILFCPAVYDIKAYDVSFNKKFTNIIRKENSWINSDAFKTLKKFKGKILLVVGQNDEIITSKLIDFYNRNLINIKFKEIIKIPYCPHKIHLWLSQNNEWKMKITHKIAELFNK